MSHKPFQKAWMGPSPQCFDRRAGQLPWIASEPGYQIDPNALKSAECIRVIEPHPSRQQGRNVLRQVAREFLQHALLGFRSCDRRLFASEIVVEAVQQLVQTIEA